MLWALSDPTGLPARTFAETKPLPPIEWLHEFSSGYFGADDLPRFGVAKSEEFNSTSEPETPFSFSLMSRPTPSHLASFMSLVDMEGSCASKLDNVMEELAQWLVKHVAQPEALFWVVSKGNGLHPRFERLIKNALNENVSISPPMRKLWGFVVSGCIRPTYYNGGLYEWIERFKKCGNTATIRQSLKTALRPRLSISRPYPSRLNDQDNTKDKISAIASIEILLASSHVHSAFNGLKGNEQFCDLLTFILMDMSELLSETIDLMCEAEITSNFEDYSYFQLPSISDHEQNKNYYDWTVLVVLCRDAWIATVETDPETAEAFLTIWAGSKHSIFRRLLFFALAYKPNLVPSKKLLDWLLSEDGHWLWATSTMREIMRLLTSIHSILTKEDEHKLQEVIVKGQQIEDTKNDSDAENAKRRFDRARWLRLKKMQSGGADITKAAQKVLEEIESAYPQWRLADDERDEFPFWSSDEADVPAEQSPKHVKELVDWLREKPTSKDSFSEDDWADRCRRDYRRSISALLKLTEEGCWPSKRWSTALYAWSNDKLDIRSWNRAASTINKMPEEEFAESLQAIAHWVYHISSNVKVQGQVFFELIDRIIEIGSAEEDGSDDIAINRAINHPVGRAASSLLNWWFATELKDRQGLSDEVKDRFSQMCIAETQEVWLGTVILAQQVIPLYRVDQAWTKQYLIPAFNWENDLLKASSVWDSFLHSPRIYLPLLKELKGPFLAVPDHFKDLGMHSVGQYASFIMYIALGESDVFSTTELKAAIGKLPVEGLERVAQSLFYAVQGARDNKEEYLKNRVIPFIRNYWSNKREVQTDNVIRSFAMICANSSSSFVITFKCFENYLRPISDISYVLTLMSASLKEAPELYREHSEEVLQFLNAIIPNTVNHMDGTLRSLLDGICKEKPDLTDLQSFNRLSILSSQHGY